MSILDIVQDVSAKCGITEMDHADFKATLMRAPKLEGESVHQLPPGKPITVFPISTLPGCPEGWIRESGSYVCPVDTEWGIWFDWRNNDSLNTAIVPSVKGLNPITGMKIEGFGLEAYKHNCPIHDIPFSKERFCEKCNYNWPPQNYVCYPNTLWWDGYRIPEHGGAVRQFFFTDQDKRDIASALIGKENTVPAFGFAFYETKTKRKHHPFGTGFLRDALAKNDIMHKINYDVYSSTSGYSGSAWYDNPDTIQYSAFSPTISTQSAPRDIKIGASVASSFRKKYDFVDSKEKTIKSSKDVSIGAGAKIDQRLHKDTLEIGDWKESPDGVVRLYFCFEEEFEKIIKNGGIKPIEIKKEGFLEGLPLG